MPDPARRRLGRMRRPPLRGLTESDWELSVVLEPHAAPAVPELISDGAGLAFAPAALAAPTGELDATDPAVAALLAQIDRSAAKRGERRRRRTEDPETAASTLAEWRQLARTEDEALFARGLPPQMLTVALRREGRHATWSVIAVSPARPLRTERDGIRASNWGLPLECEPAPEDTVLRVLVAEQTWSGGRRADDRLLAPDLHVGSEELVLTMFVTPLKGFQVRSPNPPTPARVTLPRPLGAMRLIDGALFDRSSARRFPVAE